MSKKHFPESELIINADGSCFHLHLKPEQLADKVILVGDPARVDTVAAHFDTKECEVSSREFHTVTGTYKGKRITCQSHGIGCDNIDIVVNELDTLANIDYNTREEKDEHRTLTMVRIGTCGGLQPFTPTGCFVASVKSIGFDGLLNYYAGRNVVCDIPMEKAFTEHMQWDPIKGAPYVSIADEELINQIAGDDMVRGYTISCGGFYGPQGRILRADIADPQQNQKIEAFEYEGMKICNFEMESSAVAGLASLLGHRAMTCCMVIANRYTTEMNTEYNMIVMIVSIVFAVMFLVLAVIFLMGKGDMLIAGYNTASEEERKTIDIKRLRIVMAVLMVVTAVFCTIPPLLGNDKNSILVATAIFVVITIVGVIIANTWAKKK